jgi:hypothetical protein
MLSNVARRYRSRWVRSTLLDTWEVLVRNALRMAGVAVLGAGSVAAVAVVLTAPLVVDVADAVRSGHIDTGPVVIWSRLATSGLAGQVDLILREVRCPMIKNDA